MFVEVGFSIDFSGHHLAQGSSYGQGVVEHAVRIDVAPELGFFQPLTDVGGKTGPEKQEGMTVVDARAMGRTFDRSGEFEHNVHKF